MKDQVLEGSGGNGSHARLSKNPLEGLTQVPISSAFSQGNATLPSNSLASSSLFVFAARAEGDKRENNLQHCWYQNESQFPNSQDYSINHSSPIMEKVMAPVTPDKCKRSGSDRIKEGYGISVDDSGSDRKRSAQTICFGQCSSEPANISCVGIPLHSESQEKEKVISFSVDSNSNNFYQLGPVTPDRLKRIQGSQLAKINVAESKETGECRENYNDMGPSCKETVEIHLSECTLQQSVSQNSNFSQQHNLLQEIQCNEGAELNKTPPQKTRRKRHRPKVFIEGKPPRKRKQTITKLESSPDDPPCKKRSVRRKEVGGAMESKKCVRASARKSLNFDVEEVHVAYESQASTWFSNYDTVSCSKTFNNHCQNEIVNSAKTALNVQENQVAFPQYSRKQIVRENLKVLARKAYLKNEEVEGSEYHNSVNNQIFNVSAIHKKRRTDNRKNKFDVALVRSSFLKPDAEKNLHNMHLTTYLMDSDQTERRMRQQSKILIKTKASSQTTGKDRSNLPLVPYVQGVEKRVASSATPLNVPRKKRTKKENEGTKFFGIANSSSSHRIMSSHVDHIDVITQRMQHLNINRSSNGIPLQGFQDYNAPVIYDGGSTIVPFESSFAPRKQQPRAKVDLDSETNRVWMLLMGKTDGNFPEGTDIDKEKWWEGERKVFQGRADSFIARMHLIQGDRRFSKWKGSVVDSVVGVFLTQNVSDHLSSSAFMSLAARFPKFSRDECLLNAVNQNVSDESKVMALVEQSDNIKRQPNHINNQQSSKILSSYQKAQYKEENKTCMFSYSEASASTEGRIEMENVVSSQKSVVPSQHSSESPALLVDQIGLSLESNPEIEDLETGNCSISSGLATSFTGHLHMTESLVSKEIHENQLSLSKCDEFEHRSLMSDHLKKLDKDISMDLSKFEHCPQQHNPVDGEPGPTVANLFGANETKRAIMSNIKMVPSITLGGTSILDVAETCITGNPSGKNTMKFHVQEKSACTDSCMFTRDHSVPPFPCSSLYACCQSHPCNCYCIPCEKTKYSAIKEQSILLHDNIAKCNHNEKETNIYAEGTHVELDSSSPKANHGADNTHLDQHSQPSISGLSELSCSTRKQQSMPYGTTELIIEDKKVKIKTAKEVIKQKRTTDKKQNDTYEWDSLRREALGNGAKRERSVDTMDSVDWEKVRCADVSEIADAIRERGMNNRLAARIKEFLDRLVKDHGSIDLEWLRDIPPDRVKDYLLSIQGLGLKSVECVRLLTLEHLAFPVDTNVGRICVRLGWVPLQPLPESLQLHLLELYPMLETIQKYLWPRLCRLDQRTLYELHYQMITFGKVFCTKNKPNCNACPMRGECKHFASAFASARLALPGPEDASLVSSNVPSDGDQIPEPVASQAPFLQLEGSSTSNKQTVSNCEPIIEEPATPEPEPLCVETPEKEIENAFHEDPDEIPTIKLNIERFTQNLQTILQESNDLEDAGMSKALVALTPEAASIPQPKLKNINRLRTEHQVYELPDRHPLLAGLEQREPDDPCPYLLAIWTPGETAQSMEAPETSCSSHLLGKLCESITCFSCNSVREVKACKVRGTLLIPCRTAMRGSFPLNGTYFQVNEVFADHCSSLSPLDIPRELIWNLPRRTVYFGTSVPTIFRGLTTEGIQHCFWRGFVCVRGFDQKTRAPRPLLARLHFPASKVTKNGKKTTVKEAK